MKYVEFASTVGTKIGTPCHTRGRSARKLCRPWTWCVQSVVLFVHTLFGSNNLMSGGLVTSCPITCVFLRLTVSPKSLQAELKRLVSYCSSSLECVTTAALSQKEFRKSTTHKSWSWLSIWKCWRVCHHISLGGKFLQLKVERRACFSSMVKRVPNKVWARKHPCFTPRSILKVSDEPSKTTLPIISSWKDLMILRRFGGQPSSGGSWKVHLYLPGQRSGQCMRSICTVAVSLPYSFLVIFWWRISC